jgi:outer membrane receptor protein involved in Fe transport
MTVYTGDGELIISMERFARMLKSVECGDNMVLAFNTEAAFQYAIHAWDWVNEQTNHSFLMISNHPSCGPDSQRQPYYVYGVHYDEPNFTAYLHAIKRTWTEVAHTFDLNVGQAPPPSELRPRQPQSNDNSVTWNLAGNFQHDLFTVNASGIDVGVSCQSCGVTGAVIVGWYITYENFIPQDIVFTVQPKKFLASVVLGLSLSGETVGPSFSKEVKLSVPIAGLQILDIANLGPEFDLTFGFSASAVSGTLEMSYGLTAALSDDAILTMDLLNPGNSNFSGWAPQVNQVPLDVSGEISANVEAYIQEALGISISVLGKHNDLIEELWFC